MEDPAILDIKLGSAKKISKENHKVKIYKGACNEIGCRIMGIQKGEIFKNRYFTRNFTVQEFKKSIFEFFINRKEFVEKTYNEIQFLIKDVENFEKEFKYSSLLIAYDEHDVGYIDVTIAICIRIRLIEVARILAHQVVYDGRNVLRIYFATAIGITCKIIAILLEYLLDTQLCHCAIDICDDLVFF